jgi:fumarylacetoacetate (FAA) hydrolase family protein
VFSKAQTLSAVGWGAPVGLHPKSVWNNPEPEIVLAVDSTGRIKGATIGNDVNLRDFEGRSAIAPVQGQGQQRFRRHRPIHPAF